MKEIRIVEIPPGDAIGAPPWVREAWVGLVLPVHATVTVNDAVVECSVPASSAFEILGRRNPDAGKWMRANASGEFVCFPDFVCEFLPSSEPQTDVRVVAGEQTTS